MVLITSFVDWTTIRVSVTSFHVFFLKRDSLMWQICFKRDLVNSAKELGVQENEVGNYWLKDNILFSIPLSVYNEKKLVKKLIKT